MAPPGPRRITFGKSPLYKAATPSSRATIAIVDIVDLYLIWPAIGCGPLNSNEQQNKL